MLPHAGLRRRWSPGCDSGHAGRHLSGERRPRIEYHRRGRHPDTPRSREQHSGRNRNGHHVLGRGADEQPRHPRRDPDPRSGHADRPHLRRPSPRVQRLGRRRIAEAHRRLETRDGRGRKLVDGRTWRCCDGRGERRRDRQPHDEGRRDHRSRADDHGERRTGHRGPADASARNRRRCRAGRLRRGRARREWTSHRHDCGCLVPARVPLDLE